MGNTIRIIGVSLAIVLLPAGPFATTFPVTKTDDTNDGTCDPDCSLREAIEAANANPGADDVPIPAGNYLLTLGQLVVSDDLSIAGAGQADTILDGNASDRVFGILYGIVAEISGVTIQNGYNTGSGGGIYNEGDLTLTNSTVSGNYVIGSAFLSASGGGILIDAGGYLTLTNSTVSGNTARGGPGWYGQVPGNGGGIFSGGGFTSTNSTVSGNTASGGSGGGIFHGNGFTFTLTNSTVSGNHASDEGGGIFNAGSYTFTITNSTLSGNSALYGGGIFTNGRTITITNSTVSGNSAHELSIASGGIENRFGSTAYLANSVVADNGLRNCRGGVTSLGYNLEDGTSCGLTATGDLVVADAMLYPLGDFGGPTKTHHPMTGSPAIDAGNNANCPADDQRGEARPFDGDDPPDGFADCDIGSVEYLPEPSGWGMLSAGLGLLAVFYRTRRRH